MQFYKFGDNSPKERKWVYASSIHPKSHVIQWCCHQCGRAAKYPAGSFDVTVEGGSAFPDFLLCGEYPLLIVSQRVMQDWQSASVLDFRHFPVGIVDVKKNKVGNESAPEYYRIEISGKCMVDFAESGATIQSVCSRCGAITLDVPYIQQYQLLEGSWDGSPLFRDNRFFPSISFCTEEMKRFIKEKRYTNVRFQEMGWIHQEHS